MTAFTDQLPILVVVVPLIGALTILLAGWADRRYCHPIALATIAASLAFALYLQVAVLASGPIHYYVGGWLPPLGIEFVIDYFSAFVLTVILLLAFFGCIYAKKSVEAEIGPKKTVAFYVLYVLLVTGVCGMTVTGDIFNLYVFLEISALSAYALIASAGGRKALMASYHYVIMGSLSAGFILLGIGHLYVATGTLNMADLARLLPPLYGSTVVHTAFVFFIVGLSIKTALFPLHLWLPGAYTHAPSAVSVILSTAMAKVGAYATIRILFTVFTPAFIIDYLPITQFILWVAGAAIIAGSVIAIGQTDLKRMLAYSSVSQMGYIMFGIGVANHIALSGALIHILGHALMKGTLFMAAGLIISATGLRAIRDLSGLAHRMPVTCAAFTLASLSMIGIPPTIGFMAKFFLAWGAVESGNWIFVAVILASTLLSAVYFWRVIEYMWFREPEGEAEPLISEGAASMRLPTAILAAFCLIAGLAIGVVLAAVDPAATALLGGAFGG
jgi:multicomponent Na+:H+ antiporter subunit D